MILASMELHESEADRVENQEAGLSLLTKLKTHAPDGQIPVGIYSWAEENEPPIVRAKAAYPNLTYLKKPLDLEGIEGFIGQYSAPGRGAAIG
jgi:hypothetical protein